MHNVIAVTDFIAKEDYVALKEKLEELKGTGTYQEEAKKYLEEKGYTLTDTFNYILTRCRAKSLHFEKNR